LAGLGTSCLLPEIASKIKTEGIESVRDSLAAQNTTFDKSTFITNYKNVKGITGGEYTYFEDLCTRYIGIDT